MMKKTLLSIGAVAITLLMLSSATATPYVHTTAAVKKAGQTETLLTSIQQVIPAELDTTFRQLLTRLLHHPTIQRIMQSDDFTVLLSRLSRLFQRKLEIDSSTNLQGCNLEAVRVQLFSAATRLVEQEGLKDEIQGIVEQLGTLDIFLGALIKTIGKIIAFVGLMIMTINPPVGFVVVALGGAVFIIGQLVWYIP